MVNEDGRNSSVGIATRYGLDGPGFKYRWGRGFLYRPSRSPRSKTPPLRWVSGISFRGKKPCSGGNHPPLLAPRLRKEWSLHLFCAFKTCYRQEFPLTFNCSLINGVNVAPLSMCVNSFIAGAWTD
jgi:hypothetical protein